MQGWWVCFSRWPKRASETSKSEVYQELKFKIWGHLDQNIKSYWNCKLKPLETVGWWPQRSSEVNQLDGAQKGVS